jgi:ribose transport system substrate-binding protein
MQKFFRALLRSAAVTAIAGICAVQGAGLAAAGDEPKDELRQPFIKAMEGKTVAFVPTSMGFDITDGWAQYIGADADRFGYKLIVKDPAFKADVGTQILSSLIAEKPDVIVVHNIDVQSYTRLLKKAQEAGIKVIQVNMKSAYSTDAFVGADFFEMGSKGAEYLVKTCNPKDGKSGEIAVMQGALTAAASVYQITGVMAVLEKHPEMKLVANQAADWDSSKAHDIATTILQQHPNVCGFFGFWDWQDIGIGTAAKEAGKKVEIVTSGGGNVIDCEKIEDGTFSYVIDFDVPGQARDITDLIKIYFQNPSAAGSNKIALYTPFKYMDKNNYKSIGCWQLKNKS